MTDIIPVAQQGKDGESPDRRLTQPFNGVARIATVKSWDKEFVGDITSALHDILRHYMTVTDLYCRAVPHVQSSGTGKSRTHDELAKRIFYIPLNLAAAGSTSMLTLCAYSSRLTHVASFSVSAA